MPPQCSDKCEQRIPWSNKFSDYNRVAYIKKVSVMGPDNDLKTMVRESERGSYKNIYTTFI